MSSTQFTDFARYKEQRAALISSNLNRSLRPDHSVTVSAAEAKADKFVRELRAAISIWGTEHEGVPIPFPGMQFLTGRSIISTTKLFNFLIPKGGLLHAHLEATVNAEYVLKIALEQPALHVRSTAPHSALNLSKILPQFSPFPRKMFTDSDTALTDTFYSPDTWVSLKKARASFDPALGGPAGFDKWVIAAMVISPAEGQSIGPAINLFEEKFTDTFTVSNGLPRFTPVWKQYIYEFLRASVEDGVSYVETRINFYSKYMFGEDGQEKVPHHDWLKIFDETLGEFKAELKSQEREDEFIGARIIYSTLRLIDLEELEWYREDCITLKQELPHLIADSTSFRCFDLVGPENMLKPLIYYAEDLLRFRERQKEVGVDIPFILHAGETLGDGTEADVNLYDAILLGTLRFGHGFSLVKHPKLMKTCREKGILNEVCPISNEILRLTSSMPMHPLPILINNGLPVTLCSDDPAVFRNMGLTFDFYQISLRVLSRSEVTGLIALRELARDSLKHSTLEPSEKQRAISAWRKRWKKSVESIVDFTK
ncbi:adenosine deaminase-related growth [Mycena rosella]|uniref:adenosine deaminase n=1 Tax=Mycena rosella TaxID=1033263 RepID=A0AAD7MC38_MYCRO|nr:adenosine deaminase-related growth [Mycena rosella]